MSKRLLLISNSTQHGSGYLDHCAAEIQDFLGKSVRRLIFVPYAMFDHDEYAARVCARFAQLGYAMESVHTAADPVAAVRATDAVFIGGGNTFRLLDGLYRQGLVAAIRDLAEGGMPYIGSSAGSNVACITIKTTNDMPIVEPESFAGMALVPFNLNPHYLDPDPGSTHQGETREERIRQFHENNTPVVVGLREGSLLRVEGARMTLKGAPSARIFVRGEEPREVPSGSALDFLLEPAPTLAARV
jgi:dipeptidase E